MGLLEGRTDKERGLREKAGAGVGMSKDLM